MELLLPRADPVAHWSHKSSGYRLSVGRGAGGFSLYNVSRDAGADTRYRDILRLEPDLQRNLPWRSIGGSWQVQARPAGREVMESQAAAVVYRVRKKADDRVGLNLGFFLCPQDEGKGIATAMAALLLEHAYGCCGHELDFVSVTTRQTNARAVGVAARLGLSPNPSGSFVAELEEGPVTYIGFEAPLGPTVSRLGSWVRKEVEPADIVDLLDVRQPNRAAKSTVERIRVT